MDSLEFLTCKEPFPVSMTKREQERLLAFKNKLVHLGYTEKAIMEALSLDDVANLRARGSSLFPYWERYSLNTTDPRHLLIRLFALGWSMEHRDVEKIFSTEEISFLVDSNLLMPSEDGLRSPVHIFPIGDHFIVTDWHARQKGLPIAPEELRNKKVMALGADSFGLARCVMGLQSHTGRALDLCTGSGVIALQNSRKYRACLGVDVNPRAVQFARFNARLNEVDNCEFILGDLYEVLEGDRFDLITANPPFVPTPRLELLFRDGGKGGEEVLSRIIGGCDRHLNSSGKCLIVTDLVEHQEKSYESKLNDWLGNRSSFHVVCLRSSPNSLVNYVRNHNPEHLWPDAQATAFRWLDQYREEKISAVMPGFIFINKLMNGTTRIVDFPGPVRSAAPSPRLVEELFGRMNVLFGGNVAEGCFEAAEGLRFDVKVPIGLSTTVSMTFDVNLIVTLLRETMTAPQLFTKLENLGYSIAEPEKQQLLKQIERLVLSGVVNVRK